MHKSFKKNFCNSNKFFLVFKVLHLPVVQVCVWYHSVLSCSGHCGADTGGNDFRSGWLEEGQVSRQQNQALPLWRDYPPCVSPSSLSTVVLSIGFSLFHGIFYLLILLSISVILS